MASYFADLAKESDGEIPQEKFNAYREELTQMVNSRALDNTTALMGRMSTDAHIADTVYSALHMNHAYSVDEWRGDFDSFIAVDDFKASLDFLDDPDESKSATTGAAHLGESDIASNIYYQYASICTRTLFENLMHGKDANNEDDVNEAMSRMENVLSKFLVDYTMMVPGAKQSSMSTSPAPSVLFATIGNRVYPQTADSSFEKAIKRVGESSVCGIASKRLAGFASNLFDGKFSVNDYTKAWWISDEYDSLCDNDNISHVGLSDMINDVIGVIRNG